MSTEDAQKKLEQNLKALKGNKNINITIKNKRNDLDKDQGAK